jgi:hypothetical protein
MADKTDAFGNPIDAPQTSGVPGKAPTGGAVRPSASGLPGADTATTGVPQQYDTQLASSGPQGANQSFGKSRSISFGTLSLAIFLVIIIVGVGLVVAFGVFSGIKDTYNDVKTSIDSASSSSSASASNATGISGDSLFAAGNFRTAKKALAGSDQGDPRLIALRPDRINAQLVNGSTLANVLVTAGDSDIADVQSSSPGAAAGLKTFKLSQISDAAPSRAVRRASSKLSQSTSNIDYIVIMNLLDKIQINGYFKGGEHFTANKNGGDVQKVG